MKAFLSIDFGCTDLVDGVQVCKVCGDKMESTIREQPLLDHLMTIEGFARWHTLKCKPSTKKSNQ